MGVLRYYSSFEENNVEEEEEESREKSWMNNILKNLIENTLISICSQLLNPINPSSSSSSSSSFSHEQPESLPERFTFCNDISLTVKKFGYIGELSYNKFLHPSEDESYRLVRFLIERLEEKIESNKTCLAHADIASKAKSENFGGIRDNRMLKEDNDETFDMHIQKVEAVLKDLTMSAKISHSKSASSNGSSTIVDLLSIKTDDPVIGEPSDLSLKQSSESSQDFSKTNNETVELQNQHSLLLEELESGSSELCKLDSELELLNMAAEGLLDDKQPCGLYLEQLNQQLAVKKCNIMDLKKQWDDVRLTLETKKLYLLDQLQVEEMPEAKEKINVLKQTELDLQSLSSEIQKREDERCKLYAELESQPKAAPRKSYIHRIKEITKNSRKLDSDIQRISGETRELKVESNSIRERMHRSYAVVDEMVTREVKKDPALRQVYKLVTSTHGIFEQISEKILMTDRLRREAVDYEKKLGSITGRGMSLEKLQADLNAIRKENESLEIYN